MLEAVSGLTLKRVRETDDGTGVSSGVIKVFDDGYGLMCFRKGSGTVIYFNASNVVDALTNGSHVLSEQQETNLFLVFREITMLAGGTLCMLHGKPYGCHCSTIWSEKL